jgi:hypothetical protein
LSWTKTQAIIVRFRLQAQRFDRAFFQSFEGAALQDGQPERLGLPLQFEAVGVAHCRDVLHDGL